MPDTLLTDRLTLRQWQPGDADAFASMNADPRVMRHFPSALDRTQSDAMLQRFESLIETRGWGFWALENRDSAALLGFVGLNIPGVPLPFSPCVEIGWRLTFDAWGHGYATEAAHAALDYGFGRLGLAQIVSFTAATNTRSIAVMQRLRMTAAGTFDHPAVDAGSILRRHVLYRLDNPRLSSAEV